MGFCIGRIVKTAKFHIGDVQKLKNVVVELTLEMIWLLKILHSNMYMSLIQLKSKSKY
jgi:hypothetical protein